MMKRALMTLSLYLLSSAAHSNELDQLINASSAIVSQIDKGIKMAGAGYGFANQGGALSNGQLAGTAHISTEQLDAYNAALSNMSGYEAYGSVQTLLETQAATELQLMDSAIETFTEVVVDMIAVVEVAEIAAEAETPEDKAEVQTYVSENEAALVITQEEVETYNQSLDDIEEHGNKASAYLGVAANTEAVAFLQEGAEENNSNADFATLSYDSNEQWVAVNYQGTVNSNAVFVNGQDAFSMNFYLTEAEILAAGAGSELYLTGPTALGYRCFMYNEDCDP